MDYKLELVLVPLADVDRAKTFYTEKVGFNLVVTDIQAARAELVERGVHVSGIRHMESGEWTPGPHPDHADYGSFADFSDPDGNTWVLQEVRRR